MLFFSFLLENDFIIPIIRIIPQTPYIEYIDFTRTLNGIYETKKAVMQRIKALLPEYLSFTFARIETPDDVAVVSIAQYKIIAHKSLRYGKLL